MITTRSPRYIRCTPIPLEERNDKDTVLINFDEKFIPITPEIVKYDIYDWYLVSNYGNVYHKFLGRCLKPIINFGNNDPNNKYLWYGLDGPNGRKFVAAHRLVLAAFYPELGPIDQKMDINHKDGIPDHNYISYNDPERGNIEWMSRRDNLQHAYSSGLYYGRNGFGDASPYHIINEETAKEIVELLAQNCYTSKQIVDIVGKGSTIHIVDDIRKRQCWKELSDGYEFYQRPARLFSEEDVHNFCKYFDLIGAKPSNISINDICRAALVTYGFEPLDRYVETLRKIYVGKYATDISSQYNFLRFNDHPEKE